ncbi:class I SAM-dependent methyltransferase [Paenibacillus paeoniae]|uniref:SAM-dependent methyltransferase n=1 Tax=Paenibacillus paeoniae TaxID=2292705 RepID=A0A371PMW9_9BACL|nr:class I SAM-dependent methyltransferase [Paenibacillus paeoniae]REK77147.1 SAM-dependent methyltransferase [Paenibacillus paeoniae]
MIITTAPKPTPKSMQQASRLAEELRAAVKPRRRMSVRKLLELSGDNRVIIVTDTETRYYDHAEEPPLFFHPSMAFIRVKRLRKGESDPLIALSRCEPGDRIIDCTAGMAADALVFSYAAGETGEVVAIESEPVLCSLVKQGLQHYDTGLPEVNEAMRRIRMFDGNHADYLASQPDNSVDIVYFDPMFRQPIMESTAIGAFRSLANMDELSHEVVEHAKRVARKTVIMKETGVSDEFLRLGFTRTQFNSSKIAYGVITID